MGKVCANCGAELDESALLCSACGAIGGSTDTQDIPQYAKADLPEGVTPLIVYRPVQEEAPVSTETPEEKIPKAPPPPEPSGLFARIGSAVCSLFSSGDNKDKASRGKKSHKYVLLAIAAVAVIAVIAMLMRPSSSLSSFLKKDNQEKKQESYETVIDDYFTAMVSGNIDKLIDLTLPKALINAYQERYSKLYNDYELWNRAVLHNLRNNFVDDFKITYAIVSTEPINDADLSEYYIQNLKNIAETNGVRFPDDLTASEGYTIALEATISSDSATLADIPTSVVVLKVDNRWIIYSLFSSEFGELPPAGR